MDSNCSRKIDCKYWDEGQRMWSMEGVTTSLQTDDLSGEVRAMCTTTHLTTFGGVLTIPTSLEELNSEIIKV